MSRYVVDRRLASSGGADARVGISSSRCAVCFDNDVIHIILYVYFLRIIIEARTSQGSGQVFAGHRTASKREEQRAVQNTGIEEDLELRLPGPGLLAEPAVQVDARDQLERQENAKARPSRP